jgi:Domain of unknown function (DUF5069)
MDTITAPNLNTTSPRSGRELLGKYTWLARLADKARADQAGTAGDYIAYCGLSTGFLDRAGVSEEEFRQLISDGASDADLVRYFDEHVDTARRHEIASRQTRRRRRRLGHPIGLVESSNVAAPTSA